jgi:methionyl-tRNA formyltransferase
VFVVASHQPWHAGLAETLAARTGRPFTLIDRQDGLTAEKLRELGAEMVFLPHWSHIIPASVHQAFECVIFHMTDLPYGRGGSPLQNLIVRGHTDTMISALRCEAGLDTGPIYRKRPLDLAGSAREIFLRATAIIEDMIVELVADRPSPVAQVGEPVAFRRRTPADGDWSDAADLDRVYDHIRMLDADGYPPAFVTVGDFRLEFSRAQRLDGAVEASVRITQTNDQQGR